MPVRDDPRLRVNFGLNLVGVTYAFVTFCFEFQHLPVEGFRRPLYNFNKLFSHFTLPSFESILNQPPPLP